MTNRHTIVWSVDVYIDIESNRTNALRTISMRIRGRLMPPYIEIYMLYIYVMKWLKTVKLLGIGQYRG